MKFQFNIKIAERKLNKYALTDGSCLENRMVDTEKARQVFIVLRMAIVNRVVYEVQESSY